MVNIQRQLKAISEHVISLFNILITPELVYHNLTHTRAVVSRAREIAANYPLNETEQFILISAAWFHDSGQLFGVSENHEERSIFIMKEYMRPIVIEPGVVDMIAACIFATKMPGHPNTLLQSILCDADLYHLGTEEFLVTNELVKKELELRCKFSIADYDKSTLAMLRKHKYFTEYCQKLLNAGKEKNIAIIEGLIDNYY